MEKKQKTDKLEDGTYCVKSEYDLNGIRKFNVVKNQNNIEIEIAMHYPNGEMSKICIEFNEEEIQQLKAILNEV